MEGMSTARSIVTAIIVKVVFCSGVLKAHGEKQLAPAQYVFGASTMDAGNKKILRNEEKARSCAYRVDLVDDLQSHQWPRLHGYTAEHLGLPSPPPAFEQCCIVDKFGSCIKGSKPRNNRDEHLLFDKNHTGQIIKSKS